MGFILVLFACIIAVYLGILVVSAFVRHRLLDVRFVVVRTLAYVLSCLVVAVLYCALTAGLLAMFRAHADIAQGLSLLVVVGLAFIFQPLKRFFRTVTDRLFYKDNYSTSDFIRRLHQALNSTNDVHLLLQRTAEVIGATLKATQVFFVIKTDDHSLLAGTHHHTKVTLQELAQVTSSTVASQLPATHTVRRMMASHRLELVMPLIKNELIVGYMCLGYHKGGSYKARDIHALRAVANELIIEIQNALAVEEIKRLNATLEQRINNATKELRTSNAQLQRLDEAKDEFISMASHQLRTPLTSVKGYISMVIEGDAGKISPQQKHLLEEALLSSERMVRLIGDFLNVSRLQTGKFMVERIPTDLARVVKQEIGNLEVSAKAHGMKFEYTPPKSFPMMLLDENKIRQVIMNFSDNAIYYSKENTVIKINLKLEGNDAVFTVKDQGIGVPLAEQPHLFGKFFRAENARRQRPDGTGVGLFLAKKVIDAHDGRVIFESKEGKGSTFGFRIPVVAPTAVPDASEPAAEQAQ